MHFGIAFLVGIIWLWFWIKGHWFAALLAALVCGLFPLVDVQWRNEWQLCLACLVVPWIPMAAIAAFNRLKNDVKTIAGMDAPLVLEIRDQNF